MDLARRSPLDAAHRDAGAKMVDFGGWEMPLSYRTGTLAEHLACRSRAALFDVSHLGTVRVEGRGAFDLLQSALTNDLGKVAPGAAQYTHLLDATDASVLDDIIVWWVDPERFDVMPNASNTERVLTALRGQGLSTRDVTGERAVMAVQGPEARAVLGEVSPEAAGVGRFKVSPFRWRGFDALAAGTGYTGEDGIECALPGPAAAGFWDALTAAGAVPAGLGARDTLRLEAGLPLHGHELGPGITPLQAGLAWVVAWDKGDFTGRAALERERERGVRRRLRGLSVTGRQPPRAGYDVRRHGEVAGQVTSGNFSPGLGTGIAMAFLPADAAVGETVEVDMRGRPAEARIVKMPFVGGRA